VTITPTTATWQENGQVVSTRQLTQFEHTKLVTALSHLTQDRKQIARLQNYTCPTVMDGEEFRYHFPGLPTWSNCVWNLHGVRAVQAAAGIAQRQ
jgi:hypothetical protein